MVCRRSLANHEENCEICAQNGSFYLALLSIVDLAFPHPIPGEVIMEAYCVKCKAKREIRNAEKVTLKNGRPANRGTCPNCGTKIYRIGA